MKEKKKITKESIIRNIAKRTGKTIADVKEAYETLEDVIFETLSQVDDGNNVCLKLFEGISLDGEFIPSKEKTNNLTGKSTFVESKIKPKFKITRSYCDKVNKKI